MHVILISSLTTRKLATAQANFTDRLTKAVETAALRRFTYAMAWSQNNGEVARIYTEDVVSIKAFYISCHSIDCTAVRVTLCNRCIHLHPLFLYFLSITLDQTRVER
jgi:hypothetical protein